MFSRYGPVLKYLRGPPGVAIMQSAEHGFGLDRPHARWLDGPRLWTVLLQPQMSTASMVVVHVLPKHSPEVPLIKDDHMVEALASDRSNHPLDVRVLPGRPSCGLDLLDAKRRYPTCEIESVDPVSISDEISRSCFPWKSLGDLLAGPRRSRVRGDIEVDDLPSFVVQDEEDVQNSEGGSRHGEEIDRDDVRGMIGQKGSP